MMTRVRPTLRAAAGRVLARLGDPRREVLDPLRIEWIEIPAGPFLMGDEGEEQHTVNLPAYRISRFPITVAQYRCLRASGRLWRGALLARGEGG